MLTTIITLACLWLCPGPTQDPYVQEGWLPPEGWVTESPQTAQDAPGGAESRPLANTGMGTDVEQWRPLVAGHFEPGDVDRVLCLMELESGGNPTARNRSSGAAGLMQVMPFWADEYGLAYSDLFTPEVNLWVARKIRDSQGWSAWSPYKRGSCR